MLLYGTNWRSKNRVDIELQAIRLGGKWRVKGDPTVHGEGLFNHYQALQSALWPWKRWDKWSLLILKNLIENRMTLLVGPASSTKTHNVAAFILCRYLSFPDTSLSLVSSTDSRSLELRIWGEIKKLYNLAKKRYPEMPGRWVESKMMLVTDNEDDDATDNRRGLIAVPVLSGGSQIGLSRLVGFKSENLFLAADELSFMPIAFKNCISNLAKNKGFKCAGMGNPKDRMDTLGQLAEPCDELGGWEGYEPTGQTMTWRTRFEDGVVIQLDGRDSPNNETQEGKPWVFPYIINRNDIRKDIEFYGEDHVQVAMMDYGIFPKDAQAKRVLTRKIATRFRALEEPFWNEKPLTKLFAIDAAYGAIGGDRCVGVELHYGECTDGKVRLAFASEPILIPVKDSLDIPPEDQIAIWTRSHCESGNRAIPASHVGFDSTGRGTLVAAFGRHWSNDFVAIEFGGPATERLVSEKIRVASKLYYYNFVTELWFSILTAVESDQIRGLPTSILEELCMRPYEDVKGNKRQVMPKDKMKELGMRSPDLADSFACGLELARRLGFKLGTSGANQNQAQPRWLENIVRRQKELRSKHQLVYN